MAICRHHGSARPPRALFSTFTHHLVTQNMTIKKNSFLQGAGSNSLNFWWVSLTKNVHFHLDRNPPAIHLVAALVDKNSHQDGILTVVTFESKFSLCTKDSCDQTETKSPMWILILFVALVSDRLEKNIMNRAFNVPSFLDHKGWHDRPIQRFNGRFLEGTLVGTETDLFPQIVHFSANCLVWCKARKKGLQCKYIGIRIWPQQSKYSGCTCIQLELQLPSSHHHCVFWRHIQSRTGRCIFAILFVQHTLTNWVVNTGAEVGELGYLSLPTGSVFTFTDGNVIFSDARWKIG